MKVSLAINPQLLEDKVLIEARALSPDISDILAYIQSIEEMRSVLTVKQGEEVYLLPFEEIVSLFIENKVLQVRATDKTYQSTLRLYQVKEQLPRHFLQISQSEIINLHQLDHLSLTGNGLVKMNMKNKDVTYSSRRYLKTIKEALGL